MKLSGVTSFKWYRDVAGKRVLLIDEEDLFGQECTGKSVHVTQYIDTLIKEIPEGKCLDIFLELPYGKGLSDVSGKPKNLQKVVSNFTGTVSKITRALKRKRVRVHNTDLTSIQKSKEVELFGLVNFMYGTTECNFGSETCLDDLPSLKQIKGMIDYLLFVDRKVNVKHALKVFDILGKHKKENVDKLKGWVLVYDKIIAKELSKMDTTLMSTERLLKNLRDVYFEIIESNSDDIERMFQIMSLVPVNLYNLARMFIKFDESKKRSACPDAKVENIIIYSNVAGGSTVYQRFFENLFALTPDVKETTVWGEPSVFCLTVKDFDFWK